MSDYLTTGCLLTCSFGMVPAPFEALDLPGKNAIEEAFVVATVEEIVPLLNIPTFGMCTSLLNPEVEAATAAAMGVLTPMPCVPLTELPWVPPSVNESYGEIPLATVSSCCACTWGGVITVELPAQFVVSGTP